jgi:RND family efflux transporter MFP subunit
VRPTQLIIRLAQHERSDRKPSAENCLRIAWRKAPATRHREILLPEGTLQQNARPIRSETRATLVASIARGRRWLDELATNGIATAETIAKREGCSIRKVNMTISLAFLAPDLVKAAIAGRLPHDGWVTQQQGTVDIDTVKANKAAVAVAQANVAAQENQLKVLHQNRDYASVIAPFDGVITKRNVDVGSLVQGNATSGTFMFTIMQSDVMRVWVYVPQDSAFGLAPGVDAVVGVPEIPGSTFSGKVTRIAKALETNTRTLLTEIDISNPDAALQPGVYCIVELNIPVKTPSFIVPADATIFNKNGLQVAVVEAGTVHIRKVLVTRDLGTQVEVTDGVKQGDQVVMNPPVTLVEGSKVRARAEVAAPRT